MKQLIAIFLLLTGIFMLLTQPNNIDHESNYPPGPAFYRMLENNDIGE